MEQWRVLDAKIHDLHIAHHSLTFTGDHIKLALTWELKFLENS